MEKRLVAKTLLYENVIIHDCFEHVSAHKILNQVCIQTRLEIALGNKVNKLSLPYQIQRARIKYPLPHSQHTTPLSIFT